MLAVLVVSIFLIRFNVFQFFKADEESFLCEFLVPQERAVLSVCCVFWRQQTHSEALFNPVFLSPIIGLNVLFTLMLLLLSVIPFF